MLRHLDIKPYFGAQRIVRPAALGRLARGARRIFATAALKRLARGAQVIPATAALKRLARSQDGSVAIEFSLIAGPFLALLFAIMETSLIFFAGQSLEKATADAARLIMTGQQQNAAVPQGSTALAEFKKKLCDPDPNGTVKLPMFDCTKVTVGVQSADYSGYSSGSTTTSGFGGPECIVVVQVTYEWPVYVSLYKLNTALAGGSASGKNLMKSTAVFRNEPYGAKTSC